VVDWLAVGTISPTGEGAIRAQARDDVGVATVTAEIYPPDLTVPDTPEGETPVLPVERVLLHDADGDGVFQGVYAGFTQQGLYRLLAYACDEDGSISLPEGTAVLVGEHRTYLPLLLRGD
jgi:hypothetical protein